MRRSLWLPLLLAALFLFSTPGCTVRLVRVAHPAAPVVVKPAPPGPGHVWVSGHYQWRPGPSKYVWVKGHWATPRAGYAWVPGHYEWKRSGGFRVRVWVKGHWKPAGGAVVVAPKPQPKPQPAPAPAVTVVVQDAPAPPVVLKPPKPGPDYVWVSGHYRWSGGQYAWVKGRWVAMQAGSVWVPGHYQWRVEGRWKVRVWVPGHWQRGGGAVVVQPRPKPQPVVVQPGPQPQPAGKVEFVEVPAKRPRVKRPKAPGRGWTWAEGYWVWQPGPGKYVWQRGRWVKGKPGMRWQSGRYEVKVVGPFRVKVWVAGRWIR